MAVKWFVAIRRNSNWIPVVQKNSHANPRNAQTPLIDLLYSG